MTFDIRLHVFRWVKLTVLDINDENSWSMTGGVDGGVLELT